MKKMESWHDIKLGILNSNASLLIFFLFYLRDLTTSLVALNVIICNVGFTSSCQRAWWAPHPCQVSLDRTIETISSIPQHRANINDLLVYKTVKLRKST